MLKTAAHQLKNIRAAMYNLVATVLDKNKLILHALEAHDIDALLELKKSYQKSLENEASKADDKIISTLALYHPGGKDLREMVVFLKISNEVVRAYSNTRSFTRKFCHNFTDDLEQAIILEYVTPLQKSAVDALTTTLAMINLIDKELVTERFRQVLVEESKADDLYKMVEKNILKLINQNQDLSKEYQDILSAVRRIEKISDRALSIAHLLIYAKLGGEINQLL